MEQMDLTIEEISNALQRPVSGLAKDYQVQDRVSGVLLDSRKLEAGNVFLATPGEQVDGHRFIGQVWERGASLVITQKTPQQVEEEFGFPASDWGLYIVVEDSFEALKRIATYYRKKLTIPVIGITGSVGKTSTKEFIAGVLSQEFEVLKTEANYNNEIGLPLTLLRIRPHHQVAVVEMGISDFDEMTRLSKMAIPDIAVITNIGFCHLECLGDRDGVLRAKTEIFDQMNPQGEVCLFGGDDKLAQISSVHGKRPYFFGVTDQDADNRAPDMEKNEKQPDVFIGKVCGQGLLGSDGELTLGGVTKKVHIPLPGQHMVVNASAAALVGSLLHMSVDDIVEGIEHMQPIGGRNRILRKRDFLLIDDCYNANPVSMKSSIELMKMGSGPYVAILGDMLELGKDEKKLHREVGAYAIEAGVNYLYCIGTLSREMFEEAAAGLTSGVVKYFSTKEEFLQALGNQRYEMIPKGATVLIKASHGMNFPQIVKILEGEE